MLPSISDFKTLKLIEVNPIQNKKMEIYKGFFHSQDKFKILREKTQFKIDVTTNTPFSYYITRYLFEIVDDSLKDSTKVLKYLQKAYNEYCGTKGIRFKNTISSSKDLENTILHNRKQKSSLILPSVSVIDKMNRFDFYIVDYVDMNGYGINLLLDELQNFYTPKAIAESYPLVKVSPQPHIFIADLEDMKIKKTTYRVKATLLNEVDAKNRRVRLKIASTNKCVDIETVLGENEEVAQFSKELCQMMPQLKNNYNDWIKKTEDEENHSKW